MAHISAPYTATPTPAPFAGFFRRIFNTLILLAEANPRMQEIERLNAKSDEQLATMGLKREDIFRHVMRDVMYI